MPNTQIIILAGGKGTRMNSDNPKVLQQVANQPMINHLLKTVTGICVKPTMVVGYKGEDVIRETENKYHYVWQKEQLGTGHAVMCAREDLNNEEVENIVVFYGDHPLVSLDTISQLISIHKESQPVVTVSTVVAPNFEEDFERFYHYGRIVRGEDGGVKKIVELKDATDEEKQIQEVNVSFYCFDAKWLWENIGKIGNNNAAGEYYLTDMIGMAVEQGQKVKAFVIKNSVEGFGVNTEEELKIVERCLREGGL